MPQARDHGGGKPERTDKPTHSGWVAIAAGRK